MVGRPRKEASLVKSLSPQFEPKNPIATEMFLPNHSGIKSHREFKSGTSSLALILDNSNQSSWTPSTTVVTSLNADRTDGFHLNQDVRSSGTPTFEVLYVDTQILCEEGSITGASIQGGTITSTGNTSVGGDLSVTGGASFTDPISSGITVEGIGSFRATPTGTGTGQATLNINPGIASADRNLIRAGVAGVAKFELDEDGDMDIAGNISMESNKKIEWAGDEGEITHNGANLTLSTNVGGIQVVGSLDVTNAITMAGNMTMQGKQITDITDTEALLIRKNSDAGDVFNVDTTNSEVDVTGDLIVTGEIKGSRMTFHGGNNGTNYSGDSFLKTINGMVFTTDLGYDMIRAGSVTGIGVTVNVELQTSAGDIIIEIRNQSSTVLLAKTISISGTGFYKGSTTQARGTSTFAVDDVLSIFLNFNGFVGTVGRIQVLGEIVTNT